MIDIKYYMETHELKCSIMNGGVYDQAELIEQFEKARRKEPVLFNIETTNACNMKCKMCPRTTMMTRSVDTIDQATFEKIVNQIRPYSSDEWELWQTFAEDKYGVNRNGMSENHFFLHIIPQVIVLHGY